MFKSRRLHLLILESVLTGSHFVVFLPIRKSSRPSTVPKLPDTEVKHNRGHFLETVLWGQIAAQHKMGQCSTIWLVFDLYGGTATVGPYPFELAWFVMGLLRRHWQRNEVESCPA